MTSVALMSEMITTAPELDRLPTDQDLARLQFTTLLYYLQCTNPDNGLVRDKTEPHAPASIAAIGMALATIPVVVERGVVIREFAAKITRRRMRFLLDCRQGPEPGASGYKGFSIISWTSKRAAGPGNANCPPSTRLFCSPAL
ncbi:hypothetical protein ABIE78_003510 [Sinorhizobium fredii]